MPMANKQWTPTLRDVVEKVRDKIGFEGDVKNEADLKRLHVVLDAHFTEIIGPNGQPLDLGQLLTEQQVEASDDDLLGLNKRGGGNGNGKLSAAARANKAAMGALRFDEYDELAHRGWKAYTPPKREDLDNFDDGDYTPTEYMRDVVKAGRGRIPKKLERWEVATKAGQVEATDDLGGFFLTPRFHAEVMMSASDEAPWLSMRRHFVMAAKTMIMPRLANEDTSSDEVAGLALGRIAEGGAFTEDEIHIAQSKLTLNKAGRIVRVTNELMSDSAVGMDDLLRQVFGKATSLLQGKDFFSGTGGGEPLGFLNANDKHKTDKVDGQSAVTIVYENILEMAMRLDPGGGETAVWLAHPNTLKDLAQMVVIVGTGGHAIWAAESINRLPRTLLGWPMHFTEHALTLGTEGDISLVNLNAYFYATHGDGLIVEASGHANFTTDEITFRAKLRDDGQPWRASTKTDRQSHVTSNFVTLETRA